MVPRLYTQQPLRAGNRVQLDAEPSKHLLRVLRARPNDRVVLFNGDGLNYQGYLETSDKRASIYLETAKPNTAESSLTLHLIQGISRGDRMDSTIRQAVELGVNRISAVTTHHSRARLDEKRRDNKIKHWQGIIISACEQSGRSIIPELSVDTSLAAGVATAHATRLILDPGAEISLDELEPCEASCTLLIGPESGFSAGELELAGTAGFTAIQLGPRILRTETAGPAALAILQARFGDLV